VRDPRRRYQYLLLRRIVFWCVIAIVAVFSFANELSSVATFAGLITAGVAVALQNVILSVVGYFFLIGRYGIRVGDRVQVSGITGVVVDVGLVRFHMLELVSGGEKTASGRVVAFSNSIVFQSNAGFYKQIPGTNFVWHEVALTVSPDSDYGHAEERLRGVVEVIFSEYRNEMERQYRHMEKTLTTAPPGALQPTSRLHLATSGVEVIIRSPVDLMHASEIDDRVTRELLSVIDREPQLKLAGSGEPPFRLKTDISG
jgi:small-conductance mechanosensitive channel